MMTWIKALATACIFLTRLPMPTFESIEPEDEGRSLVCFPIVGLIIGLLMWALASSLSSVFPSIILAALLTAFWAAITGGLHLDGLADSADGWLGGLGDVDRTLEIMHDPRCGSGALVAVTCLLIIKFAGLYIIVDQQLWSVLIIAPVLGRCVAPLLFIAGNIFSTQYVRPEGIANHFIEHCPYFSRETTLIAIVLCGFILGDLRAMLVIFGAAFLTLFLLRRLMIQRLGGATGDTAGAATEIIETVVLISAGVML
jgi:adenosylcobinamide-GDP ribazoletransferase